jgi:enoyl-CoA hydratase/carnithine racemase
MGTLVNYATEKGVALLTLTDPPLNALTHEAFKELDACILEARFDDDVHVVIVAGQGDAFSVGVNVNMLKEVDATFTYYFYLHAAETLERLEATPKLVIAAINGHCLAGGLELALACDLRIARAGAFHYGLPDVDIGLLPGFGGVERLTQAVGATRAMQLLVEGEQLTVDQALKAGLVNKVVPAESSDAFVEEVLGYAHAMCPPGKASLAVGQMKRAVHAAGTAGGSALVRELQARLLASQDAKEGVLAHLQKRKGVFRAE